MWKDLKGKINDILVLKVCLNTGEEKMVKENKIRKDLIDLKITESCFNNISPY